MTENKENTKSKGSQSCDSKFMHQSELEQNLDLGPMPAVELSSQSINSYQIRSRGPDEADKS